MRRSRQEREPQATAGAPETPGGSGRCRTPDLLEALPAAAILLARNGTIEACNHRAEALFGITAGAAVGHPLVKVLPAPFAKLPLRAALTAARRGHAWAGDGVAESADGPVVLEITTAPVPGPDPATRSILLTAKDVTSRRAADDTLRRNEARFRALVDASSDLVMILDRGAVVRYVSPSVEEVLGFAAESVVGRSSFELVHPDDAAVLMGLVRAPEKEGAETVLVCRLRHRDGRWRVAEARTRSRFSDPAIGGFVLSFHDITERRRAEEAQRRLTEVLEATTDFVCTADPHGRILYIDGAGRAIIGLAAGDDVTALNLPDLYPRWATDLIVREGFAEARRAGA